MAKPNVVSKQTLIESANRIISEEGLHKLTLKAVAEGAGVTQGTVFYHFRNKEQLMLEIVEEMCRKSWEDMQSLQHVDQEQRLHEALEAAKKRSTRDSLYHQLFLSLAVSGLQHEAVGQQIGDLLQYENEFLANELNLMWSQSPVNGVTSETWGILLNAMVDGLALQALLNPRYQADEVFAGLKRLLEKWTEDAQV